MKKCFISGSIKIKELNSDVKAYIEDIFEKKDTILVGDAMGVDRLVQMYCMKNEYYNVVVYSIYRNPRNYLCKKFRFKYIPIKNINRLSIMQKEKDDAMTLDCDYCLVVWNGKSKGSYANIIRALEYNKNVDVYLTNENKFLEKKYINKKYIDKLFKKNVGYTAKDIIKIMNSKEFKKASDIYIYLIKENILRKEGNVYLPIVEKDDRFNLLVWKNKITGIRFTEKFIIWLKNEIGKSKEYFLFPTG